jgi:hypothetical protein
MCCHEMRAPFAIHQTDQQRFFCVELSGARPRRRSRIFDAVEQAQRLEFQRFWRSRISRSGAQKLIGTRADPLDIGADRGTLRGSSLRLTGALALFPSGEDGGCHDGAVAALSSFVGGCINVWLRARCFCRCSHV